MILERLFGGRREETFESRVREDERVYVVGDVHGRADLLRHLRNMIVEDLKTAPVGAAASIFLGDYVDRGYETREVLTILSEESFPTPTIFLKGNHEEMMLAFLERPESGGSWLSNGGLETLRSYGVFIAEVRDKSSLAEASAALNASLPMVHRQFLRQLQLTYTAGDYFFCHAGIRPGTPLERQDESDLLWIREEFLTCNQHHGKLIVHGHSPVPEPEIRANRINIDTGAYISGRLTCLVLQGTERRFITADAAGARVLRGK